MGHDCLWKGEPILFELHGGQQICRPIDVDLTAGIAQIFGGIIPTDIQGDYRAGTPTVTTAVTNPYYHTMKDTPETVDLQLLADSVDGFDDAITNLQHLGTDDLKVDDSALWKLTVDMPSAVPLRWL